MVFLNFVKVCFLTRALISCLPLQPRLSIAENYNHYNHFEPEGPGTYAFGYEIDDPETENVQFRDEERYPNGTVSGRYGYLMPNGDVHIVRYVADERGYRAFIEDPTGHRRKSYFPSKNEELVKSYQSLKESNSLESDFGGNEKILHVNPHRFFIKKT